MTKSEFIDELCRRLRLMPADEAQKTVIFYSESIDDRIEDGMTEEEAVAAVGSIDDIVREVMGSTPPPRAERTAGDGRDWSGPAEERDYTFSPAGVRGITVIETGGDVRIANSYDGLIHVRCTEGAGVHYDITEGETLRVTKVVGAGVNEKVNKKLSMLGFSININLPNISFGSSDTDVEIRVPPVEGLTVNLNTSSGDIDCAIGEVYALHLRTGSGDVDVSGLRVTDVLEAISASGDADISDVICDRLVISTVSGDSSADGVTAREARINTVSGDAHLTGAYIKEKLTTVSVSGDIDCELRSILPRGSFESVSGDIDVELFGRREDYNVTARSASGRESSRFDDFGAANEIRAKSVSGTIRIGTEE